LRHPQNHQPEKELSECLKLIQTPFGNNYLPSAILKHTFCPLVAALFPHGLTTTLEACQVRVGNFGLLFII